MPRAISSFFANRSAGLGIDCGKGGGLLHYDYITFRSITFAQQGQRLMEYAGIDCVLMRTPKLLQERGCGYCLRLRTSQTPRAMAVLKEKGARYSRVYHQHSDLEVEAWEA